MQAEEAAGLVSTSTIRSAFQLIVHQGVTQSTASKVTYLAYQVDAAEPAEVHIDLYSTHGQLEATVRICRSQSL